MAARVGVAGECRVAIVDFHREKLSLSRADRQSGGEKIDNQEIFNSRGRKSRDGETTRLVDYKPRGRSGRWRKESNFGSSAGSSPEDRFARNF